MKKRFLIFMLCLFVPFGFAGCESQNKNYLSTPNNVSVQADGIVKFERVDNDEYYVIKIANLNLEQNVFVANENPYMELYNKNGVNYLEYDISRMLNLGESYSIQVKSCANGKKDSEYSSPISYVHQMHIDTPKTIITGNTLSWDNVYNASGYLVKVVTPSTILEADDPETIANATNVYTSQYSLNKFDFSAMLTEAGEYKFYVSAISRNNNYLQSAYSTKIVYENYITLNEPTNLNLYKLSNDWILACVIDENANSLKIDFNDTIVSIDVNASCVEKDSNCSNLVYINLNQAFNGQNVDFEQNKAKVCCQAVFETNGNNYYVNSNWSNEIELALDNKIDAPTVDFDKQTNVLTWQPVVNAIGYKVFVCFDNEIVYYDLNANIFAFELPTDFVSAAVQAISAVESNNSKLSQFVFNNENQTENLQITFANNLFEWTNLQNHYYIVETNKEILILNTNSLSALEKDYLITEICVTAIASSKNSNTAQMKPNYKIKLQTPTNLGFVSSNKYLLTFDAVENAIGYLIYVTDLSNENNQPIVISTLFASNSVDLSNYIFAGTEYNIQIQAIADKYSFYSNSDISTETIKFTYSKILDTPTFALDSYGSPIKITTSGGQKYYRICFYGVTSAVKYEVKVDFQTKIILDDGRTSFYGIDITEYLTEISGEPKTGVHNIAVRAIPQDSDKITQASREAKYALTIRSQLKKVTNIQVSDPNTTDGQFILSFDLQENAKSYSVEIQKSNDPEYITYLATLDLTMPITNVIGSTNITNYLLQAGEYYIYVTAHPAEKDYYESSDRSSDYAVVNKLQSLATPNNFGYINQSNSEFMINWQGDNNADNYLIKIVTPKNKEYSIITTQTSFNINDYISVEGGYSIAVKAVVASGGDASKTYISSPFSDAYSFVYRKTMLQDFERYGVYLFDDTTKYDYAVNNVTELTNLLWCHLLYGVDENYKLPIYIQPNQDETVQQAILRFADESSNYVFASGNTSLYNFEKDETWNNKTSTADTTIKELFGYLCTCLLNQYPEMSILDNFTCEKANDNIFVLNYSNKLDTTKVENVTNVLIVQDYANDFDYIDKSLRRSTNSVFAIENNKAVDVTTTEQLFMAVQYGFKPNFVGDSETAEKVYNNAKLILTAIATANMTDLEKATAIFDWLEYAYNINLKAELINKNAVEQQGDIQEYGLREEFYLEGLLLNISQNTAGDIVVPSEQATSNALSKAFSLLCNIEGIKTRKVNGTISYKLSSDTLVEKQHSWNKIYIAVDDELEQWYNVDLALSDLQYNAKEETKSYNAASHIFFLVSDAYIQSNLSFGDTVKQLSLSEKQVVTLPTNEIIGKIDTNYDYYSNTIKYISYSNLQKFFNPLLLKPNPTRMSDGLTQADDAPFNLSLKYSPDWLYRQYLLSEYDKNINRLQSYAVNILVYGKSLVVSNQAKCASFEFRIDENANKNLADDIIDEITSNNTGKALSKMNNNYITQQEKSDGLYLKVSAVKHYDNATNTSTVIATVQYTK